jgi:hypothetical protein
MKTAKFVLALGLVIAAIASGSQAQADSYSGLCTATAVQYDGSPRLRVTCGGTDYWAFGTAWTGCKKTESVDTLKVWQTLATSGLLSGKKISIAYIAQTGSSACGSAIGAKTITTLSIVY